MGKEPTHVLILNYNGRELLRECLPSVLAAVERSMSPCGLTVIDNGSTDGSLEELAEQWPDVRVISEPNRGLASFNVALERMTERRILLLNNDVKLDPDAIGPLLEAFDRHEDLLFSAPKCWSFDGQLYEGMRTRVRSRFGLVQGMCRVPGFESRLDEPDLTASAGPALMVDREKFLRIGGYDALYFPGRIEDLDLGFQGWMSGWLGYYEPRSVAYHRGFGSFGPAFGQRGCDRLAARNSLLFTWKNLAGRRLLSHLAWLPARLAHSLAIGRGVFASAFFEALGYLGRVRQSRRRLAVGQGGWVARQEAFFERFRW